MRELARERSRLAQAECLATRVAHAARSGEWLSGPWHVERTVDLWTAPGVALLASDDHEALERDCRELRRLEASGELYLRAPAPAECLSLCCGAETQTAERWSDRLCTAPEDVALRYARGSPAEHCRDYVAFYTRMVRSSERV